MALGSGEQFTCPIQTADLPPLVCRHCCLFLELPTAAFLPSYTSPPYAYGTRPRIWAEGGSPGSPCLYDFSLGRGSASFQLLCLPWALSPSGFRVRSLRSMRLGALRVEMHRSQPSLCTALWSKCAFSRFSLHT